MTDAKLMKSTRKSLNLSQQKMAELMGFTGQAYISKIEQGKRTLSNQSRKHLQLIKETKL